MFFVKPLAQLIAALNSNSKPGAVAAAVSTALLLSLIPSINLLWPALLLISLVAGLNWGFELVFLALFKWLVPLLDPFTEPLGWRILQTEAVSGLVYRLDQIPLGTFMGLNDSLMTGGLAVGIILWVPVFLLVRLLTVLFREKLTPRISRSKIVTAMKKVPFIGTLINAVRQFSEVYQ